ncbi:uncharacterized protein LOC112493926 [Cephus cinctus]|uniref:Uncharacterized protein LOC112493926 n=1 Tax=Cephus cinctus TaxID=211228 RepID=A0AAJ7VYE5_CEPCN|nr:uncharacterized protein LOC112493926 [Cephus cinctus]
MPRRYKPCRRCQQLSRIHITKNPSEVKIQRTDVIVTICGFRSLQHLLPAGPQSSEALCTLLYCDTSSSFPTVIESVNGGHCDHLWVLNHHSPDLCCITSLRTHCTLCCIVVIALASSPQR